MANTLTSWKEVAAHLGKGVRTVQRWEQLMGLPVRRPDRRTKGMILAYTDELDEWTRSQFRSTHKSEVELLRDQIAELRLENERLLTQVAAQSVTAHTPPKGYPHPQPLADELLWRQCYSRRGKKHTNATAPGRGDRYGAQPEGN